jgi:ATP-dependent DNA ligase
VKDLAVRAMELRPGTALDGEAVVYVGGRVDLSAGQARSASRPDRARALAELHHASYVAFDALEHPDHGDVRHLPYLQRRALLLELLEDLGPPLQAVPATNDRDVAAFWYEVLRDQGIEDLVRKHETGPYRGNRHIWQKQRHTYTLDRVVVGFTGPHARTPWRTATRPDASPCHSG